MAEMADLLSSHAILNKTLTDLKASLADDLTRTDNLESGFAQLNAEVKSMAAANADVALCQIKFASKKELTEVQDFVNTKMTGSADSIQNMETKVESMYAHSKTLDICVGEVKSKGDEVENELKSMALKLDKLKEIQTVTDELKSLENKVFTFSITYIASLKFV